MAIKVLDSTYYKVPGTGHDGYERLKRAYGDSVVEVGEVALYYFFPYYRPQVTTVVAAEGFDPKHDALIPMGKEWGSNILVLTVTQEEFSRVSALDQVSILREAIEHVRSRDSVKYEDAIKVVEEKISRDS